MVQCFVSLNEILNQQLKFHFTPITLLFIEVCNRLSTFFLFEILTSIIELGSFICSLNIYLRPTMCQTYSEYWDAAISQTEIPAFKRPIPSYTEHDE